MGRHPPDDKASGPWTDAALLAELDRNLGDLKADSKFAIAVSGGGDSTALMHLVAEWASARARPAPMVLTVDHGARANAIAECRNVVAQARKIGLKARILRNPGWPVPRSNRQAAYRQLRYHLLGQACRKHATTHLCLGHNLDDQAETFLLRLARGSGVDGLAAMTVCRDDQPVLLRPLLDVPRAALRAYLIRHGHTFVDDPSNDDPTHARVRIRKAHDQLDRLGLTAQRLALAAKAMARASHALKAQARDLAIEMVMPAPDGSVYLNYRELAVAPEELRLRVLALIVSYMAGGAPTRLTRLEQLWRDVECGRAATGVTLGGCRWFCTERHVHVIRELAAIAPPVRLIPGQTIIFDHRFEVCLGAKGPKDLAIGALGSANWAKFRKEPWAKNLAPRVGPTLPTIYRLKAGKICTDLPPLTMPLEHFADQKINRINSLSVSLKVFDAYPGAWSDKGDGTEV